jgi:hypothetical protein
MATLLKEAGIGPMAELYGAMGPDEAPARLDAGSKDMQPVAPATRVRLESKTSRYQKKNPNLVATNTKKSKTSTLPTQKSETSHYQHKYPKPAATNTKMQPKCYV